MTTMRMTIMMIITKVISMMINDGDGAEKFWRVCTEDKKP